MVRPGSEARWYCVSRDGIATLCVDELDACYTAEQSDKNWQASSPHRAVQLVDVAAVAQEIERWRELAKRALPMADALDATKTAVVWTGDLQVGATLLARDIRAALRA